MSRWRQHPTSPSSEEDENKPHANPRNTENIVHLAKQGGGRFFLGKFSLGLTTGVYRYGRPVAGPWSSRPITKDSITAMSPTNTQQHDVWDLEKEIDYNYCLVRNDI